jgi:hypothetical protein
MEGDVRAEDNEAVDGDIGLAVDCKIAADGPNKPRRALVGRCGVALTDDDERAAGLRLALGVRCVANVRSGLGEKACRSLALSGDGKWATVLVLPNSDGDE